MVINDKLENMFEYQKQLQNRLNVYGRTTTLASKQQYINQMILALHEEAVEIMRETAYKNPDYVPFGWKQGQLFNEVKFKEEIIDIMHFVLNLAIISGMTADEFYARYINKNKENHDRQEQGY